MPRMLVHVKTFVGTAIGVVALLLGACNNNSGISDQSVSDYVKSQLPPYLSISNVAIEKGAEIPQGSFTIRQYNVKIAARPQEPLFVSMGFDEAKNELISKGLKAKKQDGGFFAENESYDFRGLDKLQYLKQVNSPADLITIYGSVGARKLVDTVQFGGISFASGLENLGKPKGGFAPTSLIVGSGPYEEAIGRVLQAQAGELAKEQALAAEKKADEEKRKEALLEATKSGARYRGTWSVGSRSKIIALEFIDQKMDGKILKARFTLPEDQAQVLEYEGYIQPEEAENAQQNKKAIRLHFVRGNAKEADWGGNYSYCNLFSQDAEYDFDLIGGKLTHHAANDALLQIELSKDENQLLSQPAVPAQQEIERIRTRTKQILAALSDPAITPQQKADLRAEAAKLADRLDALIADKKP